MPWTYSAIPGYQFVVRIEDEIEGMMLVASRIKPGQEPEARRILALASAAPELYAALETYLNLPADPTEMQQAEANQQAEAALAKARGETDGH